MKDFKRPLVDAIERFKEENPTSFHVPGHKHGLLSRLPNDLRSALSYDFTELEGLDDLHAPSGVIQAAEQALAACYQSDRSFFLINGSTVGNLAMIYATCQAGDRVIIQRNAHKSIFNGIELVGAKPVFIAPKWDDTSKTVGHITAEQVIDALERYPETKAVVLTTPTYYGYTNADFKKIAEICHKLEIPVLVDEAHGAHFVLETPFPSSALALGADVVVHSAHKTLPAMTMGSYLHIRSKLVCEEKLAHYLRILQSSSPSYVILASLDDARAFVANYDEKNKKDFLNWRRSFILSLRKIQGLKIVESEDPLKLLVRCEGYSGYELQMELETRRVYSELADPYQVLFVLPLLKEQSQYDIENIERNIKSAVNCLRKREKEQWIERPFVYSDISYLVYSNHELDMLNKEWINYEQAKGTVAAASIIPYPPGIPLLFAGEKITEQHVQMLHQLDRLGAKFQGAIRKETQEILVVKC